MSITAAVPDLSGPIIDATTGLPAEMLLVVPGAIAVGLVFYGSKRAWAFFKGLGR